MTKKQVELMEFHNKIVEALREQLKQGKSLKASVAFLNKNCVDIKPGFPIQLLSLM